MRLKLLTSALSLLVLTSYAQQNNKCSTHERYLTNLSADPSIAQSRAQLEQFTSNYTNARLANPNTIQTVITVPVVIHVLYQNTTQNISTAQVNSQITVLNQDYGRTNTDAGNTPSVFQSLAVNTGIQFCLATVDPQGNPTTGIERRAVTVSQIGNGNNYYNFANGGLAIWDHNKYLNIWVCDIDGGNTLGFAYLPLTTGASDDGVVIDYTCFGTTGTASAPFDLGRTATHEVGHWFNLEHIWADEPSCAADDLVTDTPQQKAENYGCPTYPQTSQSGGRCNTTDPSSMYMNYMDYVDDACMNMFSNGQKTRMNAAINGARVGLLTSNGCGPAGIISYPNNFLSVSIFPNPSNGNIQLVFMSNHKNIEVTITNAIGELVFKGNYENKESLDLDLSNLGSGVYIAEIVSENERATRKLIIQ